MKPVSKENVDVDRILYGEHRRGNRSEKPSTAAALWPASAELDLEQLLLPDYCVHSGRRPGAPNWLGSNLSWMARQDTPPKEWLPLLPFDEDNESYGEPINDDWARTLDELEFRSAMNVPMIGDLHPMTYPVTALSTLKVPGHPLELLQLQVDDEAADAKANTFPLRTRVSQHQAQAVEELVGLGEWRYLFWEDPDDPHNLLLLFDQEQRVKGVLSMR